MLKYLMSVVLLLLSMTVVARPLVLISIDGFTAKYFSLYQPPFLSHLIEQSAYSGEMRPVFPSKTFPNHLTIVTGVYPQKHGIVHNDFYHPIIKKQYQLGAGKNDSRWLTAKPIWTLAEQQGIKTATYFWPESEAEVDGILPSYMERYNGNIANDTRLDKVIDWLKLPADKQPQFITTYFSTVDSAGHDYGIRSKQAKAAVLSVDASLARFFAKLEKYKLQDIDVIIVSDHGMTAIDSNKAIHISELALSAQLNQVVEGQTQLYVYEQNAELLKQTKEQLQAKANNRFDVYLQAEYPAHWHLNNGAVQIPDLIVNSNPPYTFTTETEFDKDPATHGFDPKAVPDMNAIFIAYGPSFNRTKLGAFNNVDVMSLMLHLMAMPKPDNLDGNLDALGKILK